MSAPVKCPRCGHLDTFMKGFLSDTCVCRVCQSQLDWREVPGLGPDCGRLGDARVMPAGEVGPASDAAESDSELSKPDQPRQE